MKVTFCLSKCTILKWIELLSGGSPGSLHLSKCLSARHWQPSGYYFKFCLYICINILISHNYTCSHVLTDLCWGFACIEHIFSFFFWSLKKETVPFFLESLARCGAQVGTICLPYSEIWHLQLIFHHLWLCQSGFWQRLSYFNFLSFPDALNTCSIHVNIARVQFR